MNCDALIYFPLDSRSHAKVHSNRIVEVLDQIRHLLEHMVMNIDVSKYWHCHKNTY